jgi:hypothetical protein
MQVLPDYCYFILLRSTYSPQHPVLKGHYATRRKVAGSSTDKEDFFNLPNPSSRIMTLGSSQPLTEMSTRNFIAGKGRPVGA